MNIDYIKKQAEEAWEECNESNEDYRHFFLKGYVLASMRMTAVPVTSKSASVTVDLNSYTVSRNGKMFKLPKKMVVLIHYFILNRNRVIPRDEMLKNIWEENVIVTERTIDVHVKKIRDAVGNDCIESVKGVGYKWII